MVIDIGEALPPLHFAHREPTDQAPAGYLSASLEETTGSILVVSVRYQIKADANELVLDNIFTIEPYRSSGYLKDTVRALLTAAATAGLTQARFIGMIDTDPIAKRGATIIAPGEALIELNTADAFYAWLSTT